MLIIWLVAIVLISLLVVGLICVYNYVDIRFVQPYSPCDDFTDWSTKLGTGPWITIVVSIFNKQDIINITLDSIVNCSIFEHTEVLLIDDCSTDNTLDILNKYAKQYNNMKVIRHKTNSGIFMTRKHGTEQATGKYIHYLDGDDTIDKYFYEELLMFIISQQDDYDVVCANNINRIYKNKSQVLTVLCSKQGNNNRILYKYISKHKSFIENGNLRKYCVYVWTKLYKTSFIKQVFANIPDTYINMAEDIFTNYFIISQIHSFVVYNNVHKYNYYLIYDSVSHNNTNFIKQGLNALKDVKHRLKQLGGNNSKTNKYIANVFNRGARDIVRIELYKAFTTQNSSKT